LALEEIGQVLKLTEIGRVLNICTNLGLLGREANPLTPYHECCGLLSLPAVRQGLTLSGASLAASKDGALRRPMG
jgi:hypothetical protein